MIPYLVVLLILLGIPMLGLGLLLVSGRVGEKIIRARPDIAPTLCHLAAVASLLAAIAFTGLFLASLNQFEDGGPGFFGLIFTILSLWCGWIFFGLGRALSRADRIGRIDAFRQRQPRIKVIGWIVLLVIPLSILRGFLIVAVPIVLLVSIGIMVFIHRRVQQGSLLSLLAISADRDLPLAEEVSALAAAGRRSRKRRLKLELLATALGDGVPLSEALAGNDSIVPTGTALAANAGEQSGALGHALREKAAQDADLLHRMYLGTPFVWLLVYFIAVLTVAQGVIGFQMYYIVPKMKKIFEDFGTELPEVTLGLINVSDFAVKYFLAFFPLYWSPVILLLFVGALLLKRWNFLKIPWLSRWFPREDTPAVLRALAYIVEAGRPLPQALTRLTEVLGRSAVRRRLGAVQKAVESGENCWRALSRQSLLNRSEAALLESAEEMGNLPFVLRELAGNVERRREYRLYLLLELMRPVVVIGLGVIVGVFCLAFFLPVIKLILDLA